MKVQRGKRIMETRTAAGVSGRLERQENGQWRFFEAGAARPAAGYLVLHDDLAFTTAQGRSGMLLTGVDGAFLVERDSDMPGDWPEVLEVTIDADEPACFYVGKDAQGECLLDHSPQVLGLAVT